MPISSDEFLFYLKNTHFYSKCTLLMPWKWQNPYFSPYSIPEKYTSNILIHIGDMNECELPFDFIDTLIRDLKIPENHAYAMMKTCFMVNYQEHDPYEDVPVFHVMMACFENLYNIIKDIGELPEECVSNFKEASKEKNELINKIIKKINLELKKNSVDEYYDVQISPMGVLKYKMTNKKFFQLKYRDRFSISSIILNAIYEYVILDSAFHMNYPLEKGEIDINTYLE